MNAAPPIVRLARLRPKARLPIYATEGAAGLDLSACLDGPIELEPGAFTAIPTGLAMALPSGYEAQIRPRSGLAARHGVTVLNSPGTIDCDYRGEIKILLINHGREPFTINDGDRVAQMVIAPAPQATLSEVSLESLEGTARGEGGFGSTGV